MRPIRDSGQRGVALITVLLVVALATIAATAMVSRQQYDIRLTGSRLLLEQARHIALAGEGLGRTVLAQDRKDTQTDDLSEDWAMTTPPLPIDQAQIMGCVIDQNAKFNLNNLLDASDKLSPGGSMQLQRLLKLLELDPNLTDAITDWMDTDINTSGVAGAEDDIYSSLDMPYRTANRRFSDISELRLVRGVDAEVYAKLEPYISALPSITSLNVNTADELLLQALHPQIDENAAKSVIGNRPSSNSGLPNPDDPANNGALDPQANDTESKPFRSVDEFIQHLEHNGVTLDPSQKNQIKASATVSSDFFQTRVVVSLGTTNYILYSLLYRDNKGATRVLQRARRDQLGQTICNPL